MSDCHWFPLLCVVTRRSYTISTGFGPSTVSITPWMAGNYQNPKHPAVCARGPFHKTPPKNHGILNHTVYSLRPDHKEEIHFVAFYCPIDQFRTAESHTSSESINHDEVRDYAHSKNVYHYGELSPLQIYQPVTVTKILINGYISYKWKLPCYWLKCLLYCQVLAVIQNPFCWMIGDWK